MGACQSEEQANGQKISQSEASNATPICLPGATDSLLWGTWEWYYSINPDLPNYIRPVDAGYSFRLQFEKDCRINIYRKTAADFAFVLDSTYTYLTTDVDFDTLKIDKMYELHNASLFYPLEFRWYLIGFYGSDTLQLQGFYEDTRKRGPNYDYFLKVD